MKKIYILVFVCLIATMCDKAHAQIFSLVKDINTMSNPQGSGPQEIIEVTEYFFSKHILLLPVLSFGKAMARRQVQYW